MVDPPNVLPPSVDPCVLWLRRQGGGSTWQTLKRLRSGYGKVLVLGTDSSSPAQSCLQGWRIMSRSCQGPSVAPGSDGGRGLFPPPCLARLCQPPARRPLADPHQPVGPALWALNAWPPPSLARRHRHGRQGSALHSSARSPSQEGDPLARCAWIWYQGAWVRLALRLASRLPPSPGPPLAWPAWAASSKAAGQPDSSAAILGVRMAAGYLAFKPGIATSVGPCGSSCSAAAGQLSLLLSML